ncbi:MAG: hypothetical protein JWN61_1902 [Pseudonocardiales bacterium]|nr:hypothetical protein [Jatrophihabitantaceae bacterium]MCW2603767.1 hypothetical protein [Pseudonocardiales bacterium]
MTDPIALDTDQAKLLGIGIIVAVVVIGFIISALITAIVGRIIVILVVVALAVGVYTQRAQIRDSVNDCDVTFFGIHLTPSDDNVRQACADQITR